MIISIASGKGGTGKTTVSVNLALSLAEPVQLLDCDVEEPNCHVFLEPVINQVNKVTVPVPRVDSQRCNGCGKCSELCQFNALAALKDSVLIFEELCHGCSGCWLVCPEKALTETSREVGVVETGTADELGFTQGRLQIGQVLAVPVIHAVKNHINFEQINIIDAPPGTSCPVIAAVQNSDYVILVTEPTAFGLNDLILAVEMVRKLKLSFGVVINQADIGDQRVREYCQNENIDILLEIPHDRRIAEAYSRGQMAIEVVPELRTKLTELFESISGQVKKKSDRTS